MVARHEKGAVRLSLEITLGHIKLIVVHCILQAVAATIATRSRQRVHPIQPARTPSASLLLGHTVSRAAIHHRSEAVLPKGGGHMVAGQ